MSEVRVLSRGTMILQPKYLEGKVCYQNVSSPEFIRRATDRFSRTPLCVSASSSISNSDDSGIERTLNLISSSPIPDDNSDSDESNSLDGFQLSSGRCTGDNFGKPTRTKDRVDGPPSTVLQVSSPDAAVPNCRVDCAQHTKGDNRFNILSYEQVGKLTEMLSELVPIHSRGDRFPVVWVRLHELFRVLQDNLHSAGIPVKGIKLNGGAASHIIGMESTSTYNDIDVLILVDLSTNSSTIQRVKSAVLDALMQFLPAPPPSKNSADSTQSQASPPRSSPTMESFTGCLGPGSGYALNDGSSQSDSAYYSEDGYCLSAADSPATDLLSPLTESARSNESEASPRIAALAQCGSLSPNSPTPLLRQFKPSTDITLRESYIYKQFRKYSTHETDCWSLISLGMPTPRSKVVELKFVDRMRRQFEFTVDSFQIHLDSVLKFLDDHGTNGLSSYYFPTVVAESVAGPFAEAVHHLRNKLILTREPEMIRGGGLLKYCRLLVNGYQAPDGVDVSSLERYMSSRFFIDFQDIESQRSKIEAFLANHFTPEENGLKIRFLQTVYRVVSGSSICLMSFERYQILNLISIFIKRLTDSVRPKPAPVRLDWFADQQKLTVDKIFFGNALFPIISHVNNNKLLCFPCEPRARPSCLTEDDLPTFSRPLPTNQPTTLPPPLNSPQLSSGDSSSSCDYVPYDSLLISDSTISA